MSGDGPTEVTPATLVRNGFADPTRARSLLGAGELDQVYAATGGRAALVALLGNAADPDLALLGLVRLIESARSSGRDTAGVGDGDTAGVGDGVGVERDIAALLAEPGDRRDRFVAVLGGSRALVDDLVSHPDHWRCAADASAPADGEARAALTAAVDPAGRGALNAFDALRVAYRRELIRIAALDLTSADPVAYQPRAAEQLAWLAEAALEAALLIAREQYGPGHEVCRLAVIGMGKTGGGELNYISDVDVIFVAEPADGATEEDAIRVGTALATGLMRACSASTGEGALWQVDPALRPEGKNGPLVRTVESHRGYYERWAKTWEFQALLKAWVSAGDREVGLAYKAAISPMVWEAAGRPNFVEDVQAMRRRVEQHVPAAEVGRQLKLGPGGLRDVEFSVQLLQLVHGRHDERLRSATTLEALSALAKGGYVGREDAAVLDEAYRYLRTLEHRIQLFRMRRTHLMPTGDAELRILGRAVGLRNDPAREVRERREVHSREVRRIHERLFYRPLLTAAARLSRDDSSLSTDQARDRLAALGFRDPAGAMRHLGALTDGVSRRASIQRTLLPVMLGWFADEADPDAGLLAFRTVSDELGTAHWYLKMLRDEGTSAERLAHVLGRSRLVADLLVRSPESASILGDASGLVPRSRDTLVGMLIGAARRKESAEASVQAVRELRRHESLRVMISALVGGLEPAAARAAWTDLTEASIEAVLGVAVRVIEAQVGEPLGTALAIVAMGSFGGAEMGFGSDADVLYVHDPDGSLPDEESGRRAQLVVQEFARLIGGTGLDPQLSVSADLRPEGKAGAMVRSLAGYATYYQRWALTWEFQALLRARPVAGDASLGERFVELIEPLRYPVGGLSATQVRDIRTMKARVEAERLPRGADPKKHLKLGRGGMTDVEWTAQLFQLQHAHAVPSLRVTGTVEALAAAAAAGVVANAAVDDLLAAWQFAGELRSAGILWRGRNLDSVPGDLRDLEGIARILGRDPGVGGAIEEDFRRLARRARSAMDRWFYGTNDLLQ